MTATERANKNTLEAIEKVRNVALSRIPKEALYANQIKWREVIMLADNLEKAFISASR